MQYNFRRMRRENVVKMVHEGGRSSFEKKKHFLRLNPKLKHKIWMESNYVMFSLAPFMNSKYDVLMFQPDNPDFHNVFPNINLPKL